jgi:CBS domain-containing protein
MLVEDIIRTKGGDVRTISAETPVVEAARLMAGNKIGILAVCRVGKRLAGLLSERDIVGALAEQAERIAAMTVDDGTGLSAYARRRTRCLERPCQQPRHPQIFS